MITYMEVEIAQPCCSVWPAAESVMGIMVMLVSPAAAKLPMVRACPEGAVTVTLRSRFKLLWSDNRSTAVESAASSGGVWQSQLRAWGTEHAGLSGHRNNTGRGTHELKGRILTFLANIVGSPDQQDPFEDLLDFI